jgi:5'-methylthioadenosine phosphorylase
MTTEPVGIIGGSGLYEFLDDAEPLTLTTPYGEHSAGLALGRVRGREVAFLPRHGPGHQLAPHGINYRANLWALRRVGVVQVLAPCAVGSLQPHLPPGTFVVPDQVVDRTHSRAQSFVESGACHVAFADPYCPEGRAALIKAGGRAEVDVIDGGVMVVVEGPRFSTRAESQAYARDGYSLVNMTGMPEAVLARELAMCYSPLALVTDYDAGVDAATAVSQAEVFAVFQNNLDVMRVLLAEATATLPTGRDCPCGRALDGMSTDHLPAPDSRLSG